MPIDVKTPSAGGAARGSDQDGYGDVNHYWCLMTSAGRSGKFDVRQLEPGPPCSVLYTSREHTLPGIRPRAIRRGEEVYGGGSGGVVPYLSRSGFWRRTRLRKIARRCWISPGGWSGCRLRSPWARSMLREKSASGLGRAVPRLRPEALARWRHRCARAVPQGHRIAARTPAEVAGRRSGLRAGGFLAAAGRRDCRTQRRRCG